MMEQNPAKQTRPARRAVALLAALLSLFLAASLAHAGARIASWNLKHLGWQNQKDLDAVASVIQRFDLVAIQEVMKPAVARRLAGIVSDRSGEAWGVTVSHTVGDNSYKEGYAFLWRRSTVTNDGGTTLYLDPGNLFAREPLSSRFTVRVDGRPLRLVLATVHITYGDRKSDRSDEIQELDEYWQWLGQTFEGKRLLMGDFNMPPSDSSWRQFDSMAQPAITRGASTLGSRGYANLYDNIWTDGSLPITGRGIGHYPEWLGLDHKTAAVRVSDHAPVYIVLGQARINTATQRPPSKTDKVTQSCIDLNQASASQLDRLDHVGPSRARAIITRRPWHAVAELTQISGLSKARVEDIDASGRLCPLT